MSNWTLGQYVGLVLSSVLGGFVFALLVGPGYGFVGIPVGLGLSFLLVRFGLMDVQSLRPTLRWLYPYESWTGRNSGED